MNLNYRMVAVLAVMAFLASACTVALATDNGSDASVGGDVGIAFYDGDSATVNFYAQVGDEWVLGISMRYHYDGGDLFFYYTCHQAFGRLYFDASKTPYNDPTDPGEYFFSFIPSADGVEHAGGGNYSNIPAGTVEYLGGVYQNYNTKMELVSTSGLSVVSNTYTSYTEIAFDANGGTGAVPASSDTDVSGSASGTVSLTVPAEEPVRDGHEFAGWSTEKDGDAEYTPGQTVRIEKGIQLTLYAVWEESSATVTFMSAGSVYRTVSVPIGQTVVAPSDPEMYGYTFQGWFSDDALLEPYDFTETVTGDLTLFAKWEGDLEFTTEPTAEMNVTPVEGRPGTVLFDATGSSGYESLLWDFGDGTTSTNTYVTHYYGQPGTYTATLTVYNGNGSDTIEYTIEVPGNAAGGGAMTFFHGSCSERCSSSQGAWSSEGSCKIVETAREVPA